MPTFAERGDRGAAEVASGPAGEAQREALSAAVYESDRWKNEIRPGGVRAADPREVARLPRRAHACLTAVGGGYPIIENDQCDGGLGISGGTYEQDQQAAEEALTALGFELRA